MQDAGDQEREPAPAVATVVELLPNLAVKLVLENQREVSAHAVGAATSNFIRLRPGDRVEVVLSPYDRTRGRITKLLRKL
ncbi:MAG: translation initiation factor IF-1 [Bryobacteraceae bacterium]